MIFVIVKLLPFSTLSGTVAVKVTVTLHVALTVTVRAYESGAGAKRLSVLTKKTPTMANLVRIPLFEIPMFIVAFCHKRFTL